jgi:hypothetical protein
MSEEATPLPETVSFEHPFFGTFANTHFCLSEPPENRPVLVGDLGEQDVTLPLTGVAREFHINPNSADGIMLEVVARSLDFVSALRPGDPVPVEVQTGDASWDPGPDHAERARKQVELALVAWHAGDTPRVYGAKEIDAAYDTAEVGSKCDAAIAALSETSDGGADAGAQVARLVEEYAFIEAMRDRHTSIARVKAVLNGIHRFHAKEMSVVGELEPVLRLIGIPVKDFHELLQAVDAQLIDIEALFGDFDDAETRIRDARNDLYRRMSAWDDIIEYWGGIDPRQPDMFNLVERARELYRFLAPRYMPIDEWVLISADDDDGTELEYGGVMTW